VLGGLLEHTKAEVVTGIPYLQDIPFVGYVFRHSTYQSAVTEVVVVVTPHLVHPLSPGTDVALPTDRGPLTNEEIRTKANAYDVTEPPIAELPSRRRNASHEIDEAGRETSRAGHQPHGDRHLDRRARGDGGCGGRHRPPRAHGERDSVDRGRVGTFRSSRS